MRVSGGLESGGGGGGVGGKVLVGIFSDERQVEGNPTKKKTI